MKTIVITYKGEDFKCRVVQDNEGTDLIVGSTKLLDTLSPNPAESFPDKEAERLYNEIFYYVTDKELALPDNELIEILAEANPDFF